MYLELTTAPDSEPISLAEAKAHLHVDDAAEDDLITRLIVAARNWAEEATGRQLIEADWTLWLDAFPVEGIVLPRPPLSAVTKVSYVATSGVLTVLAAANYQVSEGAEPGIIWPAYGKTWPATRPQRQAVKIEYTAGYGETAADVPATIRQAMFLLIGHYYKYREPVVEGHIVTSVPLAVQTLLGMNQHGKLQFER